MEKQPPEGHEGTPKATDGAENGGSIAEQAEAPPVPEVTPMPFGPGGTVPIPGTPGRKKPPVTNKVVVTQAACAGSGQLDPEAEHLLVVRARYDKAITKPKRNGEGQVIAFDYVQQVNPTWTEDLDTFLRANGLKLVSLDEVGDAIDPGDLVKVEELRREREDAISS